MSPSTAVSEEDKPHVCPHQMAFMLDNWFRRLIQNPKKILRDYIRPGDTVMDVGCGPGFFTIDMAKMVGESGKVIAADLQQQMLEKVRKKAVRKKMIPRMEFHTCRPDSIGYNGNVDFILAFYMIHETTNPKKVLGEMRSMLCERGKILIVEPKMHVSRQLFKEMLDEAAEEGLKPVEFPEGKGGRSVLFGVAA